MWIIQGKLSKMKCKILITCLQGNCSDSLGEFSTSHMCSCQVRESKMCESDGCNCHNFKEMYGEQLKQKCVNLSKMYGRFVCEVHIKCRTFTPNV